MPVTGLRIPVPVDKAGGDTFHKAGLKMTLGKEKVENVKDILYLLKKSDYEDETDPRFPANRVKKTEEKLLEILLNPDKK